METGGPLHPAIVHLPLGLAMILPFLTGAFYYLIRTDKLNAFAWWTPVILQAIVVIFTFTAMQIGEREEERVEKVVAGELIEAHEKSGQIFLILGIASLLVLGAGLKQTNFQNALQIGGVILLLVSLGGGMYTGKQGGELVYEHGAASAYVKAEGTVPAPAVDTKKEKDDDD